MAASRHLKRLRHPVAVEAFDAKKSTINVVDIVRIQLENSEPRPLKTRIGAMEVWASIHHPKAQKNAELSAKVTKAACNLALHKLNV